MSRKVTSTLCWDCKNATGNCCWSSYGKPVPGWTAQKLQKSSAKPYETYVIEECPQFIRDAIGGGLKKYTEGE